MKDIFINLVQKCICVDLLINALIKSNYYKYSRLLPIIKSENIKNIRIICYLYESINKDVLVLDNTKSIKIDRQVYGQTKTLINVINSILDDLNAIKNSSYSIRYYQIINRLIDSYFGFFSSLYFLVYKHSPKIRNSDQFDLYDIFTELSELDTSNDIDDMTPYENYSGDYYRNKCIKNIKDFFNFDLIKETISDETYEVFFENNPNNKFYQYYFKSKNRRFKVKIYDSNPKIFNLYQYLDSPYTMSNRLSKDESIKMCDSFLKSKMPYISDYLVMDENYLSTSTYKDSIETYKFKFNLLDKFGNTSLDNNLFISVNTLLAYIEEISIL